MDLSFLDAVGGIKVVGGVLAALVVLTFITRSRKPKGVVKQRKRCSSCGWEGSVPNFKPRCPQCGKPIL